MSGILQWSSISRYHLNCESVQERAQSCVRYAPPAIPGKAPLKKLKPAAEKVADLAKKVREADVRKGREWSYCGLARLCSQHRGFTPAHLR